MPSRRAYLAGLSATATLSLGGCGEVLGPGGETAYGRCLNTESDRSFAGATRTLYRPGEAPAALGDARETWYGPFATLFPTSGTEWVLASGGGLSYARLTGDVSLADHGYEPFEDQPAGDASVLYRPDGGETPAAAAARSGPWLVVDYRLQMRETLLASTDADSYPAALGEQVPPDGRYGGPEPFHRAVSFLGLPDRADLLLPARTTDSGFQGYVAGWSFDGGTASYGLGLAFASASGARDAEPPDGFHEHRRPGTYERVERSTDGPLVTYEGSLPTDELADLVGSSDQ